MRSTENQNPRLNPHGTDPCIDRLLLVENCALVCMGIKKIITKRYAVGECMEAKSKAHALEMMHHKLPQLAIIDMELHQGAAYDLIQEVRKKFPSFPIIGMKSQADAKPTELAYAHGVNGVIPKEAPEKEFLHALRIVLEGQIYISRCQRALTSGAPLPPGDAKSLHPLSALSGREVHVFQLIGVGMATKDIAVKLGLSPKTIETYRENLKIKLELEDGRQLKICAKNWVELGELNP